MIKIQCTHQALQIQKGVPILTAVVVFAISYGWLFQPVRQALSASSESDHIGSLYEERLGRLQRMVSKQEKQRDELNAWEEEHHDLLFDSSQADHFYSNLARQAASFHCHITSAEYDTQEISSQNKKNQSVAVMLQAAEIQLIGTYDGWIRFLEWMESAPQIILTDSLHLESVKDRPGFLEGRLEIAIPVRTEVDVSTTDTQER